MLQGREVLEIAGDCTIRRQDEQYLIYNPRSDEMHLVSPWGHYLLRLCDGLHTVSEIEGLLLEGSTADRVSLRNQLHRFLRGMIDRGVLADANPGPGTIDGRARPTPLEPLGPAGA